MGDEATQAVKDKISGVMSEQGSAKDVGSEPPKNFGHDSAPSAGTSGNMMPGTKK
jgi:hypothetical protein